MLPLGSVKRPKRLLAWFAESPEGTGLGSRNLPIKSWVEWNHGILQLVPVMWKHPVLPDRTDLSFQLRSLHLRA
jgi:hypothetical protein